MKRLTFLLSALFIALASVFADVVAKIGDTDYETLEAAVAAVGADETIVLQANLELTATVNLNVDKKYTIDLNGKTISNDTLTTHAKNMFVVNAGDVTLTNGSITSPNGRGVIAYAGTLTLSQLEIATDLRALCVYDAAHVILENGSTLRATGRDYVVAVWGDEGKNPVFDCYGRVEGEHIGGILTNSSDPSALIINIGSTAVVTDSIVMRLATGTCNIAEGANLIAKGDAAVIVGFDKNIARYPVLNCAGNVTAVGDNFAISGNGTDAGRPTVNILPGANVTSEDVAIYQPENGILNISGGLVQGATAVYVKSGEVNITGGKLAATGADAGYNYWGNGANSTGDALTIDNCGYPGGAPTISITNGEFESQNASAVGSYALQEKNNQPTGLDPIENFIEGGTFTSADNHEVANELMVEGLAIEVDPNTGKGTIVEQTLTLDPKSIAFDAINILRGENRAHLGSARAEIILAHFASAPTLEVEFVGDASIFSAALNAAEDSVLVSYTATAPGNYSAKVRVHAGSVDDTLSLSLVANELIPSIVVTPTEWSAEVTLNGDPASAESDVFDIQSENLFEPINISIKSALLGAPFTWDDTNKKVQFQANAADTYKDTLVIASSGVVVEVPLQVIVNPRPVINVTPESWEDARIILNGDYAGTLSPAFTITVDNSQDAAQVALKDGSRFSWNAGNNTISFSAYEANTYKDTLIISVQYAETKKVPLQVVVLPEPGIMPDITSWEDAVVILEGSNAHAEQAINIGVENLIDELQIAFKNALSQFTWDATNKKVVFDASAVGIYKDTIVLSSTGAETVLIPLQVEVKAKPVISVDPEEWNTTVTLEGASVEANQVFAIQVANQIDAPTASIKDGSSPAFAWDAANSRVTFNASIAGTYNGTLVITSTSAVDFEVPLQVVVNAPAPVIIVSPTEWKPEAIVLADDAATLSQVFSITVENQIDPAEVAFEDGSHFAWNEGESKVTFNATQAGNYKDTLIITATGAETKKVALEIEVLPTPVIHVNPTSWSTEVILEDANVVAQQTFAITVDDQIEAPVISFQSGAPTFRWSASANQVIFLASATGTYKDTMIISSTGAAAVRVPLEVVVNAPAPVISVDPAEWKDEAVLENGNAAAEQAFDIQISNSKGGLQAAIQSGDNSQFAWDADNSKVTFAANAVGNYKDTLIVSATDAESFKVALEITVKEPAPIYNKVTAIRKDMSGKYLIVHETSATAGLAFNGLDAANNNIAVTIDDSKIAQYDLESYLVTIAKMEGGYSLKIGNKYLEGKSGVSALYLVDEASLNTLAIENGELNIVSQGSYLRYNESASRFRYYNDISYNNIKSIALYRLYEPTTTLTVSPKTASLQIGETAELNVQRDGSDDLVWGSADENIATVNQDGVVTAIAEGEVKIFATANNISDTCVVTVTKPAVVITAGDAALAWGNLTIEEASAGQKKETTVSVTEGATLSVELEGAQKDNFLAEIKEGKLEVTFTASEAGNYAATAVLKAEGAANVPVALSATVKAAPIIGDAKNDTIVFDVTGLTYGGDRVQYEEKSFAMPSGAEYTIQAGAGKLDAKYLQMRSSGSNSGLICTKSAGKITSVTIKFNAKTAANNIVNIYASNTAYDSIHNSLYSGGSYVAQIAHADGARQTYIFEEDFEYIGIRSKSGAIYLDTIIISRDQPEIIPTTTLAISPDTAEVEVGEKVTLDIQRDGNDKLVWGTSDESIATVDKGVVTGIAAGTVKIFATANNISDTCIVIVKDASAIEPKSIAEFIAAGGGKCYLTGIVSNIKRDNDGSYNKYGNFTLTDKSGSIYVYGLLTADGEAQQFKTMGVDEHDTLTVLAQEYKLYNKEVDEVINAVFVSVNKFHQDTVNIEFTEAQAIYYGENEGLHNFGLQMFSFAEWDENGESVGDGVLAELDLFTDKAHSFAGTYSTELGDEVPGGIGTEFSYIVVIEGTDTIELGIAEAEVSITSLGDDEYRVEYSVVDEEGVMHCGVIERIEILAYTEAGSEYPIDNTQAIENTKVVFDPNAPVYNIQGIQVDRNTPGILIQKGYKFILVQ